MKPRPHQAEAIKALAATHKAQCIMPCGTGKTLVQIETARTAARVVVIQPSIALVSQNAAAWRAQRPGLEALALCSRIDLAEDEHTEDLRKQVTLSSDAADAAACLSRGGVVFTTYASAPKLFDTDVDLVIYDEAHRTAGSKDKAAALTLASGFFGSAEPRRLFFTATPRVCAGDDMLSMHDETVYGPVGFEMTYEQASNTDAYLERWGTGEAPIVPFQVVSLLLPLEEYEQVRARYQNRAFTAEGAPAEIDIGVLIAATALRKVEEKYGVKRTFVFTSTCRRAAGFASVTGGGFVTGYQKDWERARVMQQLIDGQITSIANARYLTEGVDVPTVDAVMFADPRQSVVDIVQALGRAVRRTPGKERALVIVPVPFTEEGDLVGRYSKVGRVFQALVAHDSTLREQINHAATAITRKTNDGSVYVDRVVWDAPVDISLEVLERIEVHARRVSRSKDPFGDLLQFYDTHGRWPGRPRQDPLDPRGRLSMYANNLRKFERNGRTYGPKKRAEDWQCAELNKRGFPWGTGLQVRDCGKRADDLLTDTGN